MQNIYFTPGPAQLYPTVKNHILKALELEICSLSHRSKDYIQIQKGVFDKLKQIYNIPEDYVMFVGGSGTYFMEKLVQNCVNQNSFHFVNGSFSRRFYEISRDLQKNAGQYKVPLGQGFKIDNLQSLEGLKNSELITFTACETSTGVRFKQEDIYKIKSQNPNSLIAVDMVSAAPDYDLDFKYVDSILFSVQKGFGLPAGLGILICSQKCLAKSQELKQKGICTGSYHSFPLVVKKAIEYQTLETPNVLGMYLLDKVLSDMLKYGIAKIREETEQKYQLLTNYFSSKSGFRFYVKEDEFRSRTVLVVNHQYPDLVKEKLAKHGMILGGGYGEDKDNQFRIANFPAVSVQDIKNLLEAFEVEF